MAQAQLFPGKKKKRPKANSQKNESNTKTQDDNLTATWHLLSDGSQLASHNSIYTRNIVRKSLLRKSMPYMHRCNTSCTKPNGLVLHSSTALALASSLTTHASPDIYKELTA